ncbi:MAG TPA: sulfurtransferase TusA family protein [Clostridiaceae bacterium]|jgi:TusA-related sulfurtransferase|nr:sulfurtransferase TusA family protein [Clostridiaceae bacterium]
MKVRDLDCLYEACPIPLIKAIKELRRLNSGDILVVHSDESCVGVAMVEWAEQNNYQVKLVETEVGEWEIYVQKP